MALIYKFDDPWRMNSEQEQFRFKATNQLLLKEKLAPVSTILELGCGEGHQSVHFAELCEHLHGIDVSTRAVARAQARLPDATFRVSDLLSYEAPNDRESFDLVVACEIFYYIKDVGSAYERVRQLGKHGLITYFWSEIGNLDPFFKSVGGLNWGSIQCEGREWRTIWW